MQLFRSSFKSCIFCSALCIAIIFCIASCTKADVQYGSQFEGNQYTNIVLADTFSIETGTVGIDSFQTAASGTALIGSYKDAAFGQVNAESYFQLQPPTLADKTIAYDSLELVLKLNRKFYGDSTKVLPISVYKLLANILKSDNTAFDNIDQIAHESSPIGSKQCFIYPSTTDTIAIRLDDNLGKTFLNLLLNGNDEVSSADNFTNYFKGLCISTGQSNAYIVGFSDSIQLRLHYRDLTLSADNAKAVNFTLYNNSKQFNHISVDRTGTLLANLNTTGKGYLSSTATGNQAFMQSITGSVIKLRVPYLRNLQQLPDFIRISKALLHIKPVTGTYDGFYTLPDSLRLSATDKNNNIGSDLTYPDGSVQYGQFYRDYLYNENTSYTYDITTYLTQQLAITTDNENGVMLSPPAALFNTDAQRLIIGDQHNKTSAISLELYYLSVQ